MLKFVSLFLCLFAVTVSVSGHHNDDKADYKQVNGELTVKMMQTLTEDDNALFSPILLTNSLLMLANAASGDGRAELLKALNLKSEEDLEHVNMDAKHIFDIREHLLEAKNKGDKLVSDKTEFDLLPKLLIKSPKALKESFAKLIKDNYPMESYKLADWSEETQKSETKTVNDWFVSKSATGLMSRMLDDNDLTSDVRMMMLNGAGFRGAWRGKLFKPEETKEAEFRNPDGKVTMIEFMNRENAPVKVNRYEDDKTLWIEIPFTEHDDGHGHKHGTKLVLMTNTSMEVTLDKVLEDMTQAKLYERIQKTLTSPVKKVAKLSVPKMRLEKEYELKDSLAELGVKGVFEAEANFSRMLDGADLSKSELSLNQLEHKAVVQWTEEGDDSTMDMATTGDEPAISLDSPFVFFILDDPQTDSVAEKKMAKRHTHSHEGHDHSHEGHKHDESMHNEAIIVFAGRVKTFSKDLTLKKEQ